jgi:aspartyl-tRNA(Asn)/glutamyl-tRNA(Gln) amidotransferase subunit C
VKVSEQDVAYVAELAHLELDAEERARMLRDLNAILEYIGRLAALDTSGVEPMAQAAAGADAAKRDDAMRDDERRPSLPREDAVANAPESDGAHFRVPKVIEK